MFMKLPAKLIAFRRENFPTQAEEAARHEAIRAEQDALFEKQRANDLQAELDAAKIVKRDCAQRLQPFIGRLVLVTNFKGLFEAQHAERITEVLATDTVFQNASSVGISAHLLRHNSGTNTLLNTARVLASTFETAADHKVRRDVAHVISERQWLPSIIERADRTRLASAGATFGHIAVVGALDIRETKQSDIKGYPDPGTAFRLATISEDAKLGWEIVSGDPSGYYLDEHANSEMMQRLFEELGDS
jgi:hypothetical protein